MKAPRIRPLALAVIRDGGRLLVFEGRDPIKPETFYRPLGGGIEFGERGADAVARELREEIGAEIANVRYLGTLENLFHHMGEGGHEICLMYEADLVDRSLYGRGAIEGIDPGEPLLALWKPLTDFGPGKAPLYPDGLLEFLAARP